MHLRMPGSSDVDYQFCNIAELKSSRCTNIQHDVSYEHGNRSKDDKFILVRLPEDEGQRAKSDRSNFSAT